MLQVIWRQRFSFNMRMLASIVLTAFTFTSIIPAPAFAQMMRHTPSTSIMLQPTAVFNPLLIKGIQLVPENPLRFDFIVDKGNSGLNGQPLKDESALLVKYFLTALTIPEKDMWVNLSPFEKDSIIADSFIQTQMGKILLEQDYVLKQMTASLTYPETSLGKQFWGRVYQKAYEKFGTTDVPIDTFNKVWIVPKSAEVVNYKQGAVIINSELDVMVESDYLAIQNSQDNSGANQEANQLDQNKLYSSIIREIIIPELRREVNEGKYFAPLRQVYHALILATWYKRNLRNGILSKIYIRQNKVDGVKSDDPQAKEKVYEQYLETFRKGIYNYIREDFDESTQKIIPRKYTSGGMEFTVLGLGGDADKYRELAPTAINSFKPMLEPVIVSSDLTLLTPQGDLAVLPAAVDSASKKLSDGIPKTVSIFPSKKGVYYWFKKIVSYTTLATVFGIGMLYPQQALGAQYSQDIKGSLIINVEQGDTYGQIMEQLRMAYRAEDPMGYQKSKLSGTLWGPQGVVNRMSEGENVQTIMPDRKFVFEKGLLPENVIAKLIPSPKWDKQEAQRQADLDNRSPVIEDSVSTGAQVQAEMRKDPGLYQFPLDLLFGLGGFTLWLGARKAFTSYKRKKQDQKKGLNLNDQKGSALIFTPATQDGIKFITSQEELPRLDDIIIETTQSRTGVFVESEEPVASDEENLLWQQDQLAHQAGARASVRVSPAFWPMDLLGAGTGVFLTGISSDWNFQTMGIAAIFMPLLTRAAYGMQVLIHETLGHFIPALVFSPNRKEVLSVSNFFAHYGWKQWIRLFVVGFRAPSAGENPGVDTWTSGWRKKMIAISGFAVSFGVGLMASFESMNIWLPLLGPVGISSLAVLAGSYSTDIKNKEMSEGAVDDQCGRAECGIFGALWSDKSKELYPQWVREGFGKLINALIIRGGQSAGEFTIGLKSSGKSSADGAGIEMVPILSKVLKYKRGQGLSETLDQEFSRLVNRFQRKNVTALDGVKGILGHVRFATGGKVTREASHPHMGVQEEHEIWTLKNGTWTKNTANIFAAIGHNGDNDAWSMWGHQYNTAQIRELFPAIFRMPKTYKVEIKKKNPQSGQEIKEIKYEALPPGDSPPLALQIHFLLTQGDWLSSVRFAFMDRLVNDETTETANLNERELEALAQKKLDWALKSLLTEAEENILKDAFQAVFLRHAQALSRSRLTKADKSFSDLWVTPEIVAVYPSLQYQLNALNAFRDDLKKTLAQDLQMRTEAGLILQKAGNAHKEMISQFVDEAVKMFFTGSRSSAVEQFARRSHGSYGLAVRTSKEPNGVSLYSADQGVTIGYNQKSRLVTFSSEHSTLQYAFGAKGKMDDLVFINPEQPGQMADINLSPDLQSPTPISIKVYSFALNRTMTAQEIAQQQFPQDKNNPYWTPQISYKDPDNIIMADVQSISKEVHSARLSWDDPRSFNRQSADSLLRKMVSRHLEHFIKANSRYYGAGQGNLLSMIFSKSTECLAQGGCDAREASRRSAQLSNRIQADGRVIDYLKSRMDWVVSRISDELTEEMMMGKLDETQMTVMLRETIDLRLKDLMDDEIKTIVNAIIDGNLEKLTAWSDWETARKVETLDDVTDISQIEQSVSQGFLQQGLKFITKLTAGLMTSEEERHTSDRRNQGHSLDAGETDMMIAGYEDSLWLGENFVEMMKSLFPKLKIWATSANKAFNLNGEHRVGRTTIGMIISKSGATYPSRGIVRRLKQISPGNIYAMTSRVDNLIAMSLGQKFQPDSPFIKRVFVTGNYYPAEANSVGEVMLFAHQIELAIYLAEGMQKMFSEQKPWGMKLNSGDIKRLKELRDRMYDEALRLTGYDENGEALSGNAIRQHLNAELEGGYLRQYMVKIIKEKRQISSQVTINDIKSLVDQFVNYSGSDSDAAAQAIYLNLWNVIKKDSDRDGQVVAMVHESLNSKKQFDDASLRKFLQKMLQLGGPDQLKMMEQVYLQPNRSIVKNGHALGKTMTETGIVSNIVFRVFVMMIFWFGAPLENIFTMAGVHFGSTLQDAGGLIIRTLDGVLTLFAPWLMTTLMYRIWSGRPQWSRLGAPTVALGDPIPALHQTNEGYWSKLGAVSLGSMSMDIHGANPDDHFVARLAHRVVRGTIAIFGVPMDSASKENVIVSMRQTKAIINGIFMNFFKGGAEVFSIGRGEINNPDVTDHHMNIGEQDLQGASSTVRKFNNLAFDAFGRHIAYKMLFAHAYFWATHWEPRITLFGKTLTIAKFSIWNPAWTYSRTGVHTTRSPKGGPTHELPEYLDPSEGIQEKLSSAPVISQPLANISTRQGNPVLENSPSVVTTSLAQTTIVQEVGLSTSVNSAPQEPVRGGIDLNTKWLDLKITGSGEMNIFLDGKNIEMIPIRGIIPRILEIRPVTMSSIYLIISNASTLHSGDSLSRNVTVRTNDPYGESVKYINRIFSKYETEMSVV